MLSSTATIGNMWDSLYNKHQMQDSDITLDKVYTMFSEFPIEVKLSEKQDKIAQIVTRSNGAQMKPTSYDSLSTPNDIFLEIFCGFLTSLGFFRASMLEGPGRFFRDSCKWPAGTELNKALSAPSGSP